MSDQEKTTLYPAFIKLAGRSVLVVGGGPVATRKVFSLLPCRANVTVVSPESNSILQSLHKNKHIQYHKRFFQVGDLEGVDLVFVACGDGQVNQQIAGEANRRGILCNVADVPELSSFYVPAVVECGPLQIAISTSGVSPALAKHIRQQLETQFDSAYETFLNALAELRQHVKQKYPEDQMKRAEILEGFVQSQALMFLKDQKTEAFQRLFEQWKQR